MDTGRRFITRPITRPELSARITALGGALDVLLEQAEVDRRGAFRCTGSLKNELLVLEAQRRDMDRQAAGFIGAIGHAPSEARLRAAHAELQATREAFRDPRIRFVSGGTT